MHTARTQRHKNHALNDWGNGQIRMAFACNSAGETRGNRGVAGDGCWCAPVPKAFPFSSDLP